MSKATSKTLPTTAAEWDARLRAVDCSEAERQAFQEWCAANAENAANYEALQTMLARLREARDAPEIRSLREAALDTASPALKSHRPHRWFGLAAAIGVLAIGLVILNLIGSDVLVVQDAPSLATSVGERSTTTLEDGSVAVLNTNSRVQLAFSDQERRVILLQGQALFEVSKDPDRPFVVMAGEQRITAVGTVFDVRIDGDDVQVALVEGVVEVKTEAVLGTERSAPVGSRAPVQMTAGHILFTKSVATPDPPVVEVADVERVTIWRQGQVVFDDEPLSEAVAEMNRYSTTTIVVRDAALDRHRVSGMFLTGHQTNFVLALEQYFPINADRDTNGRVILTAAPTER